MLKATDTVLPKSIYLYLLIILSILAGFQPAFSGTAVAEEVVESAPASETVKKIFTETSEVEKFLVETLMVEEPTKFLLNKKLQEQLENGLKSEHKSAFSADGIITEAGVEALQPRFSVQSKYVLKKLIKSLGRETYSNSMLVGPAGAGKTFVMNQLVAILSYGVVPDFLDEFLGKEQQSPFINLLKDSYLQNTQIVSVDYDLLSRDNTRSGQAYAKSEVRMRSLLMDIFHAAKDDFKKNNLRTVFVLEEVAQLPPLVQQTLKTLLDDTGFKTASYDPLEKGAETGFSVVGVTTPGEYRDMIGSDSAIERRYEYVFILEPTEEEALEILIKKNTSWFERYELLIEDHVLAYVISMRSFFSNPPLAMPHSVLKVMDGLMLWASERSNRLHEDEITVEDAYRYLIEQSHLPKGTWIPEDRSRPPLWNLQEKVQSHVIGHEEVIKQIVRRIKTGRTTGFSDFPVFIIMGPSGTGKDTLARAINLEMFGHDGAHLNFDVGGPQSKGLAPLLDGGHDGELPALITALNEGTPNGVIVLNEAKGLNSKEFDRLKVLIETGIIRPKGRDSRMRPLGLNVLFIMGQYGEELLEGKTTEEINDIVAGLSETDLINILMAGEEKGAKGAIPYAVIQRAIRSGGIFFLKPTDEDRFVDIAKNNVQAIVKNLKVKSQLDVEVDETILQYVASLAILNKRGTRGLDELLNTFTSTAISESYELGLPLRGVSLRLVVDLNKEIIHVEHILGEEIVNIYDFEPGDLLTSKCQTLLSH